MGGDTADRRPIVAICYDFDKTLSPTDMQAQGYIQSLGLDVDAFWRRSGALAKASNMDQNLAYMYTMLEEARGRLTVSLQALHAYGARVKLYPGVREWFGRTRRTSGGTRTAAGALYNIIRAEGNDRRHDHRGRV